MPTTTQSPTVTTTALSPTVTVESTTTTVPELVITVAPPDVPSTGIDVNPGTISPTKVPSGAPKTGAGGVAHYLSAGRVATGSRLLVVA